MFFLFFLSFTPFVGRRREQNQCLNYRYGNLNPLDLVRVGKDQIGAVGAFCKHGDKVSAYVVCPLSRA